MFRKFLENLHTQGEFDEEEKPFVQPCQVKDGKPHGYGVKTWKSGQKESGFYRNGLLDGFGIQSSGNRSQDEFKIQGKYRWKGDVYKGSFERDLRNGHGTYTWANGDIYVGNFVDGDMNGQGKKTYKESGKVEEGEWKDDKFLG